MKRAQPVVLAALMGILYSTPGFASFHLMQIEQVIGGANGNTDVQAIQLRMRAGFQNQVQSARLMVRDAAGNNPVLLVDFASSVPNSALGSRVLAATPDFVNFTNPPVNPDFILTSPIPPAYLAAGTLTFEDDFGTIYWRLSWGGAAYTGPGTGSPTNDPDGNFNPPFADACPAGGLEALLFGGIASAASSNNANDYSVTPGPATFTNNAGQSGVMQKPPGVIILPGSDLFTTPAGASHQDFGPFPIPADFFGPGSDPFDGVVRFQGLPIDPTPTSPLGPTDTIVERLDPAPLTGPGDQATVPIEIVALSLVSVAPITVTHNGGQNPELWDVEVCLSSAVPRPQGQMEITAGCELAEGGAFRSQLPVQPRFVFTRVESPHNIQVLDTGVAAVPPIQFQASGWWTPHDPGFNLINAPPGLSVDHDCDVGTPPVGPLQGSSNFFPGVRAVRCDSASCVGPPSFIKRMTFEQSLLAQHGVLPAQLCTVGDLDSDGVCDDADNCPTRFNPSQSDQDDDGVGDACDNCPRFNPCQEDLNGNGLGDLCEVLAVGNAPLGPQVMLGRPSPNPISGTLSYAVTLPSAGRVRIQVFDVRGGLITTLVDDELGAGQHDFTWNPRAASLRSGVYYLRLAAGEIRQARAFTYMR